MRSSTIAFCAQVTFSLYAGCALAQESGPGNVSSSIPVNSLDVRPQTVMDGTDAKSWGQSPMACDGKLEYVPWPAFSAPNYTVIDMTKAKPVKTTLAWPNTADAINKLLPNIATQVTTRIDNASGNAGGLFGASMHKEHITIDFMKYRSEEIFDNGGQTLAYGRVGAGMRLLIELETSEGSLGGSLFAIAASAKAGRTTGTISADIIGMDASDITLSVPFTTDLSEGSIQKIVEALAVVKTKFRDPATTVTPQFMAKINCVTAR